MHRHLHWYLVTAVIALGIFVVALMTPPSSATPSGATNIPSPVILSSVQPAPSSWTMTAVGDIMLDRSVRTWLQKNGVDYPFTKIKSQLTGDVVLANLEGPITTHASVATTSHLIFTFDPKVAPALRRAGFTIFSLANNHAFNFSQAGLNSTRTYLTAQHLSYFGDPNNRTGYHFTQTLGGRKVTFLGYHGLVGGFDTVLQDIRNAHAKGEMVIVMAHSGTEYNLKFTAKQQTDYRKFIDAGADMVIAAHPHVIEPIEIYKNKLIAYSLGNFVFDQYFSTDTQQGLMLKLEFHEDLTVQLVPLDLTKSQPKLADATTTKKILNRIAGTSVATAAQRAEIAAGTLTLPLP